MNIPNDVSDSQLILAIQQSEHSALKTLHSRYAPQLYQFLWRRVSSIELAKDLLQDVFLRLWDNRTTLVSEKSIKAYLYRTASNLTIDYYRKNANHKSYNMQLQEADFVTFQNNDFDLRNHIETAVNSLSDDIRATFILSRYEELSYSEIAETLGISIKTVESRMGKALKFLREKLQDLA